MTSQAQPGFVIEVPKGAEVTPLDPLAPGGSDPLF